MERRFGRFAIPNLTAILFAGQAMLYVLGYFQQGISLSRITLEPDRVLAGEWWRLITFLFVPPNITPVFVIFYFLLLYQFGTSLEMHWGAFRYNVFLLTGYVANLVAAFVALYFLRGQGPMPLNGAAGLGDVFTNAFLYGSIFLAFARLYPDFTIMLFFIVPVKIKWLAMLQLFGYVLVMLTGDWMSRMAATASLANYLMFFGREHWRQAKHMRRRQEFAIKAKKSTAKPRHVCAVCGVTSDESPKMLFRYCSKCAGQQCYCPEHIQDHVHVTEEELAGK
jgi:hypothetical protein